MLIIAPPSESKRQPPESGPPLALDELSFPALNPMRRRVLRALTQTSMQPDAFERLRVGPALVADVARDTHLRDVPTLTALAVYSGPLHQGLDAATLTEAGRLRAEQQLLVVSALWGALRPADRIPPYRLHVCARLVGLERLEPGWRTVLPSVLAHAAGPAGVVLDLRSSAYQAIGKPTGAASRTVTLRVLPESGERNIGDVVAKRIRGQVARYVLECAQEPAGVDDLADLLGERWPIRLDPPAGPSQSWTIRLRPRD